MPTVEGAVSENSFYSKQKYSRWCCMNDYKFAITDGTVASFGAFYPGHSVTIL